MTFESAASAEVDQMLLVPAPVPVDQMELVDQIELTPQTPLVDQMELVDQIELVDQMELVDQIELVDQMELDPARPFDPNCAAAPQPANTPCAPYGITAEPGSKFNNIVPELELKVAVGEREFPAGL